MNSRIASVLVFVLLLARAGAFAGADTLREKFKNPPRQYSLLPFWAWNDTLEPERLKWQIDQMVDKNVYGAFMHARVGINKGKTPYFSEGWWQAIDTAITHGKKVGFYPWLYDEDKWPSGSAGGRTVAVNPEEFSQKGLVFSTMEITGPQQLKIASVEDLVAIIAARFVSRDVVDEESLCDISSFSGKSWDVPEGRWLIMNFKQIREKIQPGRATHGIDYLDQDAVAAFIKITHEEYYKRFAKHFGSTTPGIFFDEMTARLPGADFAWTDDFLEKFSQMKGYDLKKYLPLLVYDGGDITPKVRCDYYDVFTTLYEEAWFKQISDWCSEHNILLTGHTYEDIYSYVTQGDYFRTLGHLQIPLTDNEDFRYSFPAYIEWFKPKQIASVAHLNNRDLIAVEALGGNGWSYTLEELRYGLSMLAVYGINFMVLHGFYYTTDTPATSSDFPPSWFYQNPHWKYFGQVGRFAQRLAYMGRQGNHVCDVAILYPITSQWASGRREGGLGKKYTLEEMEDILSSQYYNVQKTLLDNQTDYDIIDPASLCKADVSKGKIKIAKQKYSVLILPPLSVIKQDTLEKVKNFYNSAGTVIAINTLPLSSMEAGRNDSAVIQSINDIFGFNPLFLRSGYFEIDPTYAEKFITNRNEKGGRAYFTKDVQNVPSIVARAVEKDIIIKQGEAAGLRFLHNATEDLDIYYLINEQKVPRTWTVSFRATGAVERWHPETGRTERIYGQSDGRERTEITLSFSPWESYYVLFDKAAQNRPEKRSIEKWERADSARPIDLDGQWDFIPLGRSLDYKWQSQAKTSQIELPVMDFYAERAGERAEIEKLLLPACEGICWKQIKVKDKVNKVAGCGRYLSCWDGWWITYADLKPHWGTLGGDEVTFRKEVVVDEAIKSAWLGITADKEYRFCINGRLVGEDNDWKNAETYDTTSYLKTGANLFEVIVKDGGSLLVQGKIVLSSGKNIDVLSDGSWQVADKSGIWVKAFEYVNPPLGPWGNVELSRQPLRFPLNVWYRRELPKGAVGITAPVIKGDYKLFINGRAIDSRRRGKQIDFKGLLNDDRDVLLIKVGVKDFSDGLIEPVTILCEPTKVEPDLWENYGLDWYSGRCLYSKEFVVPDEYINADTRLAIDLGEVRYFAEVWINDKLAGVRIWPPYEVQIQDYIKPGGNTVSLVIANLIANKMKWDVFDESLTSFRARWGHNLCLLRRPDILDSGVLGPIKIIPLKKTKLEVSADN